MFRKLLAWLKEECPYCRQRFIDHPQERFPTRGCPDGHVKVETHSALEVQIHFHQHI